MTYNVTVTLVFECKDEDDAIENAENALSFIPNDANVEYYEVHHADLNRN